MSIQPGGEASYACASAYAILDGLYLQQEALNQSLLSSVARGNPQENASAPSSLMAPPPSLDLSPEELSLMQSTLRHWKQCESSLISQIASEQQALQKAIEKVMQSSQIIAQKQQLQTQLQLDIARRIAYFTHHNLSLGTEQPSASSAASAAIQGPLRPQLMSLSTPPT